MCLGSGGSPRKLCCWCYLIFLLLLCVCLFACPECPSLTPCAPSPSRAPPSSRLPLLRPLSTPFLYCHSHVLARRGTCLKNAHTVGPHANPQCPNPQPPTLHPQPSTLNSQPYKRRHAGGPQADAQHRRISESPCRCWALGFEV